LSIFDENIKKKISLFCDIDEEAVIESLDAESLYEIPLTMEKLGLADVICKHFKIKNENLSIGIISHIDKIKEFVPIKLEITKDNILNTGSSIKIVTG